MKSSWKITQADSSIHFKVKYLQISNLNGVFGKFRGHVNTDNRFEDAEISLVIEAGSVETLNPENNEYLRSSQCLAAARYPYIQFQSNGGCHQSAGKIWELTGELMVKTVRAPVTFIINHSAINQHDKIPNASFHLFGSIDRKEFDLGDGSNVDFGDEIQLRLEICLIKQS